MGKPESKYIYLIGNSDVGFHSHTIDKNIAKEFVKQRKGKYQIKKVRYTQKLYEDLSCNTEIVCFNNDDILMSAMEEEYLFESFAQWESDILFFIKEFMSRNKYVRYSKDEKRDMKELHRFLQDYETYYREVYINDEKEHDPLFNNDAIAKWFVDHICEGFQR